VKYEYDDYGNVIKTLHFGDLGVSGDEVYEHTEYLYNTNSWIMDKPKRTETRKSDDTTKISETFFSYDSRDYGQVPTVGDLTKAEGWLDTGANPITGYTYDSYGNMVSLNDPNAHTTTFTYDAVVHTFPVEAKNALNQATTSTYDYATGNVLSVTDANGIVTEFKYDDFGRKTKDILPYDSLNYPSMITEYQLDGSAPEYVVTKQREISGTGSTLDSYFFVDGFGNLIQDKTEAEASGQIITDYFYDENNRLIKVSNPTVEPYNSGYISPTGFGDHVIYTYDVMGRIVMITNPDSTVKNIEYDRWVVDIYDEENHRMRYESDGYGRIKRVDEFNEGSIYNTLYSYDEFDNVIEVQDNNGNHLIYSYDTLGQKIQMEDPDLGIWTYSYDAAGNLVQQTDGENNEVSLEYDNIDRIKKKSGTESIHFYYDEEKIGVISRVELPGYSVDYSYDNRMRVVSETKTIDGEAFTTGYEYDSMDRITKKTLPDTSEMVFSYNSQGLVESIQDVLDNVDYNPLNQPVKKEYHNSLDSLFSYNSLNFRLEQINTGSLQNLQYSYDGIGNVLAIQDTVNNEYDTYGYDDLSRIVSAEKSYVNGISSTNYTYDSIGNMLRVDSDGDNIVFVYYFKKIFI